MNFNFVYILEFLEEILVERCCLNCTKLQFFKYDKQEDIFFENYYNQDYNAIVGPVEFRGKESSLLGHHLAPVFQHREVYFLALQAELDSYILIKQVVQNALLTWPLFVTALSMAVLAGVIIWVTVCLNFQLWIYE